MNLPKHLGSVQTFNKIALQRIPRSNDSSFLGDTSVPEDLRQRQQQSEIDSATGHSMRDRGVYQREGREEGKSSGTWLGGLTGGYLGAMGGAVFGKGPKAILGGAAAGSALGALGGRAMGGNMGEHSGAQDYASDMREQKRVQDLDTDPQAKRMDLANHIVKLKAQNLADSQAHDLKMRETPQTNVNYNVDADYRNYPYGY